MKYLKYFPTEAEYNAFIQSEDFILPNVSYAVDTDTVFYNIVKTESGDYKIFILEKKDISELETTYEMVDLGLPSGLLWADRNIGASSPEDFGTYFAWGETEGYNGSVTYCTAEELCAYLQPMIGDEMELTPDNIDLLLTDMGVSEKDISAAGMGFATDKCFSSDFSDYFDTTDGGNTFNKYATDKLTVLEASDDAARANMGSDWRMPTEAEMQELIDNTTPTFIDLQDNEFSRSEAQNVAIAEYNLKGVRFTGSNGNSIFIPASGCCIDSTVYSAGSGCDVFSSNLHSSRSRDARSLIFNYDGNLRVSVSNRCDGLPVRGVCNK